MILAGYHHALLGCSLCFVFFSIPEFFGFSEVSNDFIFGAICGGGLVGFVHGICVKKILNYP